MKKKLSFIGALNETQERQVIKHMADISRDLWCVAKYSG